MRALPARSIMPTPARLGAASLTLILGALLAACGNAGTDPETAEAVREAVRAHIQGSGKQVTLEDPIRGESVQASFDYVHEHVAATPGGRQVVCVDFRSSQGKVYDVDYYLDRKADGEGFAVEDSVLHKVGDENVLAEERREELDQAG